MNVHRSHKPVIPLKYYDISHDEFLELTQEIFDEKERALQSLIQQREMVRDIACMTVPEFEAFRKVLADAKVEVPPYRRRWPNLAPQA